MKRLLFLPGLLWAAGAAFPAGARAQVVVERTVVVAPFAGSATKKDAAKADATPAPATLRWNNGETLTGAIGEAGADSLTWKTPFFDDPLSLAWSALHRIDQPGADLLPMEPFAFALRDGSFLYGELTGISADGVRLHSEAHGDVTLRRADVLSARRIHSRLLTFAGPQGDAGWSAATLQPEGNRNRARIVSQETLGKVPTLRTGPGGALELPFFDRAVFLPLELNYRVDVGFHVSAAERPAFSLVLDGARQRLRVETWGDQLVVASGDGFALVRTLDAAERDVSLRVCWDSTTRECEVYTPQGNLLTQWTAPEEKPGKKPGVTLLNKGRQLTLDFLRVREWNGESPPKVADLAQPRLLLDDGSAVFGSVSALEEGRLVVPAAGEGPPVRVPLADVDAIGFAAKTAAYPAESEGATLSFADGTFLRGRMAGIKDGAASVQTAFADAPVPTKLDTLRELLTRVPTPAGSAPTPPLKTQDKIVLGDVTLHGKLVVTGDAVPHWLPVGGTRPATPARAVPSEILRAGVLAQATSDDTSLFYTRAGDAIPGKLHGMDRQEIEFESPVIAATSLPTADVEAVQFDAVAGGSVQGFGAPGWQVTKGPKDVLHDGKAELTDSSMVGHAGVMGTGEVRFDYETANFSCLRLRIFCDLGDPTKSMNLMLFRSGSTMSAGIEPPDGQFYQQNRLAVKSGPVTVRLVVDEDHVRCYLNDLLATVVSAPNARRTGSGLILEPAGLWGNSVEPVTLSAFAATAAPGQAFLPTINAGAKAQALTVPRFRKEDPPRQALLAANGDLLRGEIEAITNTQFGFRVGLEELHIPRDRVRAVVALQKPSDAAPTPPPEEDAVHKALEQPLTQRFGYSGVNLRVLISALEQNAPELKFKLPREADQQQSMQFRFEGATIGDNLDNICELFGMRYRIEKGVIIIEARPPASTTQLAHTVYWLKPGAFGEKDSAEAVLTAKGIAFPAGCRARWQEGSQSLEVVNTPENQAKVVEVLNRDFGGVLGSPTHWVQMMDGGRLGLAVESFGPDEIRGTQPIYGKCTVPMAQVYAIRNTLPEPTAASQAVRGWQLVYAPEPVLPESGGEGSALLGKAAPTFKLKMLGGGDDFDLAKEKGHIVVLDFWATWCGPCVRSLPGLIEVMAQFPADRVRFVGLDQAEAPEQVKRFLETRGWKLSVAMDAGQNVARQYGVDGIPHTVIVGPDGKVAWVKTGYTEDGDEQAAAEVKKLLAPATGAPPAAATPAAGVSASTADGAAAAEVARK